LLPPLVLWPPLLGEEDGGGGGKEKEERREEKKGLCRAKGGLFFSNPESAPLPAAVGREKGKRRGGGCRSAL